MKVQTLLNELRKLGVQLQLVDSQLKVNAPAGKLTPADVERIRENRAEIIAWLEKLNKENYRAIPAVAVQKSYPLSNSQRRLWVVSQLEEQSVAYNIPVVYQLTGTPDVDALRQSFDTLAARHESLRTVFVVEDGEPRQRILDVASTALPLEVKDYRTTAAPEKAARDYMRTFMNQAFDLEHGPLMRVALLQWADDQFLLVWSIHHIIADEWSMQVMGRELVTLYNAFLQQTPHALPDLKIQYRDYTAWQREELSGAEFAGHRQYWLSRFSGELPVLELPTDRQRQGVQQHKGSQVLFDISAERVRAYERLLQPSNATLFMGMTALVNVLLFRYSGQSDLIIGTPIAGREHPDLEDQIGYYLNTLALRNQINGTDSFTQVLSQVRETTIAAFSHQAYPFDLLVEELGLGSDQSRSPLFDVVIILQNIALHDEQAIQMGDVSFKPEPAMLETSKSDLRFQFTVDNENGALAGNIEYNTDLYDRERIVRMSRHLVQLMDAFIDNAAIPVNEVVYQSEDEMSDSSWFTATPSKPAQELIHKKIARISAQYPEKIAVSGDELKLSYGTLNTYANQVAHLLITTGVAPETAVGVYGSEGPSHVALLLATFKAGALYVPMSAEQAPNRLLQVIAETRMGIILTTAAHYGALETLLSAEGSGVHTILIIDITAGQLAVQVGRRVDHGFVVNALTTVLNSDNPDLTYHEDSKAYVFYTSGSTGKSKGIVGVHASLAHYISWHVNEWSVDEQFRISQLAPMTFDASLKDILVALVSGATLCIPPATVKNNSALLVEWLSSEQVTLLQTVPSLFRLITSSLEEAGKPLTALRYVVLAGERLYGRDVTRWKAANGTTARLSNLYGLTETTILKSCYHVTEWDWSAGEVLPVGYPITHTQIAVINSNNGLCEEGEIGEVYIRSPFISSGYIDTTLNEQSLVPNPLHPESNDLVWRTGDLGRYRSDRSLEILGRRDEQVKINGVRIELQQVRSAVLEQEGVIRTELVVHTDEDFNQELICYYTGKRYPAEQLREQLSQELHASMLPGYYVWLDSFPLNMNGKVDRKALPKPEEILSRASYIAPHEGVEQQLAGLWQQVLGIERISRDDSFFNVGGSSLKAIQLIARIYKELDVQLTIATLFANPVLSQLAELIGKSRKDSFLAIPKVADQDTYPLSNSQKRMWVLSQVEERSLAYNVPILFHLRGALNDGAMKAAFDALVARHESLRTVFVLVDGEPRQRILSAAAAGEIFQVSDYRTAADPMAAAKAFALALMGQVFDLEHGPLMRVALLQIADDEYLLAWCQHHIMCDEWSMQLMSRELVKLYNAINEGRAADLRALPIQYRDYASWLQTALSNGAFASQREYWLSRFTGDLPVLDLPADRSRPAVQQYRGSNVLFSFSQEQGRRFQELLKAQDATLFMGITALVDVLLYRYSGQSDLIVGTPVAGRVHADLEDQIGYYLNTLALRNQVKGKESFVQLLSQVKDTTVAAFSNQSYPFDALVEDLELGHDQSRAPLFDVLVILQNIALHEQHELQLNGVSVELELIEQNISKGDLRFQFYIDEVTGVLQGNIEYNTDLFDHARIERMARHLTQLMDVINTNIELALDELVYQSPEEYADSSWFTSIQPKPAQGLIHKKIEAVTARHPESVAARGYGLELSYGKLNTYANQVAHLLLAEGVVPETAVGVYASGGPLQVALLLATFKAGGVYVPMSADQAPNRLQQVIAETGMGIILTTSAYYSSLEALLANTDSRVHTIVIVDVTADGLTVQVSRRVEGAYEKSALSAALNIENPDLTYSENNRAYVFYTSGSTGNSKGIVGIHGSLSHYIRWHAEEWSVNDSFRISQLAPMTFDASLKDILVALISGATVCMPEPAIKQNSALLVEWLRAEQITLLQTVPSLFRLITAALEETGQPLSALRYVVLAGERLYGRDVTRWQAANGTTARLSNLYGLTETTILKSCYHVTAWDWSAGDVLPVGYPISHSQIAVINSNNNLCEEGEMGEVYIRSPYITQGYIDQSLNEQSLVPNPLNETSDDLVWRTGDLGRYRSDRSLEILGRRDEQVKINGVRIELQQVRSAVLEQEGITRTELIVHTGEDFNQELICYYTGTRYTAEELREQLLKELHAAMLPGYYVWLDSFPLNMNGKVDRKALPKPEEILSRASYVAPHEGLEQQVAGLWQQVLGIDRISREDNFFNIGGSSLKAIQLIARIYKELDVQLTIATLFANPVLSQLGELIRQSRKDSYRAIPKVPDQETYPLSNSQKRLWVLSQIEERSVAYNMSVLYRLNGALNVAALTAAFRELVARHESLRTVFVLLDGEPAQRILSVDEPGFALEVTDYRTALDPETTARAYAQQLFARSFDLEQGPLMRAALLQVADNEYLLAWSLHHIISDEWSMQVTSREIITLYNAFNEGKPSALRALPIQYRDYSCWQQEALSGEQSVEDRNYWLSQFTGELPVLELPADRRRPDVQQYKGSQLLFEFTPAQFSAYQKLLQQYDATLFMGMTALVNVLLYRYSGQSDLIIGTPVAGREHADLEDQIGYYLNTLALRNQVKGKDSFAQLLAQVKDTTLSAFSHQSYPFDLLIDDLGLNSNMSRAPLFDVLIVLQNIALNEAQQLQMDGVTVTPEPAVADSAKGDLRFQFAADDTNGVLYGGIEYSTDLFDHARIERMARHLTQLMDAVIANATVAVNELAYQSPEEYTDSSWFTSIQPKPTQGLVHKKIEAVTTRYRDSIAARGYGLELSYGKLNTYANQVAHLLLAEGIVPEVAVGVYASGGPLQVALLLATFKAGGVYVPMSADQAPNRLQQVIGETSIGIILTTPAYYSSLETLLSTHDNGVHTILIIDATADGLSIQVSRRVDGAYEKSPLSAALNGENPDLTYSENNRAYVFYTSGSTGNSKGIGGLHGSLSHYIRWHAEEWSVNDSFRISQLAPMTFDASLKDILVALTSGATVSMPEPAIKQNSALLVEWLRAEQITLLQTVPSLFRLITTALEESGQPLSALRYVVLAGERLYGRDVTRWQAANGTTARLSNLYGLTETTILKSCYHVTAWDWSAGDVLPVGYPISHSQIAVINSNNSLCEEGEMGEVYIRSPYITQGYIDQSLNEQSLVPNPLNPESDDLVWRTGDLGRYRSDRSLEILGRRDEQVKINGVRIELQQVRSAVLEQEGITRTELIVHTGEDFNQELICYYTGTRYTAEELREQLSRELHASMLPGYYVWLDSFPLNMNGKVDRKALPKPEEILSRASYVAPHEGLEQQVASLWQHVLGIDRISREDNFFNIGGSSLKAIQLIARIYKELDVQLTIATLFANPVLSQLVELIRQSRRDSYRAIPKVADQETYPLSNSQKRMWVLSQIEEQSVAYNMVVRYKLNGEVNTTAVKAAFQQLIVRHESLRTVFVLVDGEPRQRILPAEVSAMEITIADYSAKPDAEATARQYAEELLYQSFDLEQGPLMRAALLQIATNEYLLVWAVHHIISDEWSMQLMGKEVVALYNKINAGKSLDVQPLPLQYRDFASWQRNAIAEGDYNEHRQYWLSQFAGEIPVLDLPADRHRPETQRYKGSHVLFSFSGDQGKAYNALLQRYDATLFMGITALIKVLLYRYSGQPDLIIGTPVAGREHPDLQDQIGYYLNTLALRNQIKAKESFAQVLSHVRETTIKAFSHQMYPYDLLVEELDLGRDMSRAPLFDVVIILQNIALNKEDELEMDGVAVSPELAMLEISKSDLRFQFSADETSGVLYGNIEYNTDLYDHWRIERMARHLTQLMDVVIANASQAVDELVYQSEEERSDSSWFTSIQPKPAQGLIHKKIEAVTARYPDSIAARGYGLELSYSKLNTYANQVAHLLLAEGIVPETAVGVYASGGPLQVALLLATFKAGGVYVPMSADQAPNRLQQVIAETAIGVVLTTSAYYPSLEALLSTHDNGVHTIGIVDVTADGLSIQVSRRWEHHFEAAALSTALNSENPDLTYSESNRAYVFYTSGSTGNSKGIVGIHGSLSHYIRWHAEEWSVNDSFRISQLAPMTFDASLKDILVALISAATVCMPEPAIKQNSALLVEWLRAEQITLLQTVPSLFRLITAALEEAGQPLSALRYVVLAGERLYGRDVTRWHSANGTTARLSNLYGLTETTILKSCYHVTAWDWSAGDVLPVGYPISHSQIAVVNSNNSLCEEGEMGEVYIRSPYITQGYIDQSLNEQSLVPNPLNEATDDLVWRTGDLGRYRSDRSLEILGRRDEQVKINGVRIELQQVRSAVLEQTGVTRTELIVHTGEDFNQELICYYTGTRYTAEELREQLSRELHASMLPGYYVWLDSFPLNMNGKVDRKALPKPEEILSRASYVAPHEGLELQVAGLWQQVLGIERISREDNFFNIGGSSLKAIQLIARIYKELDVQLTIATLFANPVLSHLTELIRQSRRDSYRAIPKVADQDTYPLSNSQKRMWVLSQIEEQSVAYNMVVRYKLQGSLDLDALTAAFRELIARHESLRTVFVLSDGEPRQRVLPVEESGMELAVADYRGIPDAEVTARKYAEGFLYQSFDLQQGPLMRATLLQVAADEYVLAWSVHHIISDEWSMQLMSKEVVTLYNTIHAGKPLNLQPLPLQYRDFASWQRNAIAEGDYNDHRQYWLSQFAGEIPVLDLPSDRYRPAVQRYRGSHVLFSFSGEQSLAYSALLQRYDATLFMGITALINVLLYRYSGQPDLIIGTPVAGREHPDLQDQIGYYLNTLALRNQIKAKESFAQVLSRVRETTIKAFSHQMYPYDLLVEELDLGRDMSRAPLFDVVIILQNIALHKDDELEMDGLSVAPELAMLEISKSDLRFQFSADEASGVLYGNIEYNTDLYDHWRIERMARHLTQLMDVVINNASQAVDELSYQSEEERSDSSWFTSIQPKPAQGLIHKRIESVAAAYPESIAARGYGLELSYGKLNTYANQVAHLLLAEGIVPEAAVGVYASGGPLQVALLLATFKAGGVYVPMSADQAPNRLQQVIGETSIGVILTTPVYYASLEALLATTDSGVHTIGIVDVTADGLSIQVSRRVDGAYEKSPLSAALNGENPDLTYSENNRAYVFYTSGSTGNSKGIVGLHGSLSHYIRWHAEEWSVNDSFRISQLAPMTFDASLKDILVALISGATVSMPEPAIKQNSALLVEWLRAEQITLLQTVPSLFRLITTALEESGQPLSALRYVVLAGERLYGRDVTRWQAANGTTARLSNLYGLTETTILKSCYHVTAWDWSAGDVLPVGYPISHSQIAVINSNNSLCEEGEMGEVYIRSPYITQGYINQALNEQSLVLNPLNPESDDLVWRTGDLGRYRSDRSLEILGRRDEQVKINGVRIELQQVRSAILEQDGVTRTELIVHTGEDFNQELICYYTGTRYTAEELREQLSRALHAAMLPGYYVWLDSFPLNMNGKVDRKALPKPEEILSRASYVAPHEGLEQQVARLWQHVLGIDRISREDNFFNIGGSSLKAIQLIARIYKELDVQLTIATLFAHPVLSQLTVVIQQSRKDSYRAIPKVADQETYPLSNSQKRLWVLDGIEERSVAYTIPALYRLRGKVDTGALVIAFRELVARHESLRTVFVLRDGEPRQLILSPTETGIELQLHDYRDHATPEVAAGQFVEELLYQPFDLGKGPLLNAALLQIADDEYLLAWSIHHIIADEWSIQIIGRELIAMYNAYTNNTPYTAPPLPVQYRDFASWQRDELAGEGAAAHRQYWLAQFADEIPVLELPADRHRPEVQGHKGSQVIFRFSNEQHVKYEQLLKQHQATLFMGLTALVNVLLYRYSGQSDLIIGTPVAGREHPDLEDQIGYYLNTLALRSQIKGTDSFVQVLSQMRQTTLAAFAHQSYPFDLLVEELGLGSDLSRSPLFDVVVILQNISINSRKQLEMNGVEVVSEPARLQISKSDIRFQFFTDDDNGVLHGNIEYNTDLYDRERIERMARHLCQLMEAINENPEDSIYQIQYLVADEQQQTAKRAFSFNAKIDEDLL